MTHPLCHKRSRERLATTLVASSVRSIVSKSMWILVAALCAAPLASAEIFKCVGKNGTDLYQNFPCQFDSLGSLPSSPPPATTRSPLGDASLAKPKVAPVDVASPGKSPNLPTEPRVGMTTEQVRALWGEPEEIIQDEPIDGRIEIWRYGDVRSVQFDRKQRVLAVQR
jgi:hypothetical protein